MSTNNDSELDYFELKYLEEISRLFNSLKETDNYYGIDLFKRNFYDYFEFIQRNVIIHEFNEITQENEDDSDEEHNIYKPV
tara:strand:+ start:209 stop:451 length:243 start_codon:yes stop_codon:yes gene_type:complete